ncbi:MAG: NAD-dependent epimerase/dehydratase family protein [Spirochaetes bacterium]|nr:NAD-dependent epimerase/dehydratase family protein [Spirochaetota bacterium]
MKILVTGGAGFIGSHLCDELLNKANSVVVVDNLSLGKIDNIKHLTGEVSFKFYREDLLNYKKIVKIFRNEQPDIVFHMAANSDIASSIKNPEIDLNNTYLSTFNVLNVMRELGISKLFFASSSAIYGDTFSNLTENFGPLLPISHYGAGKLASEAFISSFSACYDIQSWIVRFPNVVGERATHGVIYDFINKLKSNPGKLEVLGDGEQYKPYLYVKDLVDAMLFIWNKSSDRFNVFNIGVESRTKVRTIALMVVEEMGLNTEIKYSGGSRGWVGDVPVFNYNLSKLHNLGWKAKITSDEAVKKSIRYILGKTDE